MAVKSTKTNLKNAKKVGKQEKTALNKALKKGEAVRNKRVNKAKKQIADNDEGL